ncbi:extracellular solute-binding protein [Paenibacillus sp. N3.4]|uniref:extracellular solute-binding protein n=1 Tax=Paenibacillus sp. N3.4 TaxID=2603222 RepID=UPI001C9D0BDF|nr:extracellular solute-binding protein [Paenibacillus sp. N3.4]
MRRKAMLLLIGSLTIVLSAGCAKEKNYTADTKNTGNETSAPRNKGVAKKPKITVSVYDRGQIPSGEGDFTNNRWTNWINENAPVEVEFIPIPRNDEVPKLTALFASGNAPDLVFTYSGVLRNDLFAQKQTLPLDDLIEKHSVEYKNLLHQYPAVRKLGMQLDGKIHTLTRVTGLMGANHTLQIRADWLKKLKLDIPKTTEELFNVAKAFAELDPDGNNKKDTYGIQLSALGDSVIDHMYNYAVPYLFDSKQQLVRDWERAKVVTEYKKRFYDAGLVDKDYLTDVNGEKAKQDWVNGKLGIRFGNVSVISLPEFETLKKNNPAAEVIVIPLPESPYGQFSPAFDVPVGPYGFVNAKAKNPEAVIQYIDFLNKESTIRTLKYGFEGEHWKKGDNGCPAPIDIEKNKKELNWNFDYWTPPASTIFLGECALPEKAYDPNIQIQKEFINLILQAKEAYISPKRPKGEDVGFMPPFPSDLQLIQAGSTEEYLALYQKSIVGGTKYSVEQAVNEAKTNWLKRGGEKVDKFIIDYYTNRKDIAFISKVDTYAGFK